jgi:hypothetical protein
MIVYKLIGANSDYPAGVHYLTIDTLLEMLREDLECWAPDIPVGDKLTYTIETVEMTKEEFDELEMV